MKKSIHLCFIFSYLFLDLRSFLRCHLIALGVDTANLGLDIIIVLVDLSSPLLLLLECEFFASILFILCTHGCCIRCTLRGVRLNKLRRSLILLFFWIPLLLRIIRMLLLSQASLSYILHSDLGNT
jgi:hypothetical protein